MLPTEEESAIRRLLLRPSNQWAKADAHDAAEQARIDSKCFWCQGPATQHECVGCRGMNDDRD